MRNVTYVCYLIVIFLFENNGKSYMHVLDLLSLGSLSLLNWAMFFFKPTWYWKYQKHGSSFWYWDSCILKLILRYWHHKDFSV